MATVSLGRWRVPLRHGAFRALEMALPKVTSLGGGDGLFGGACRVLEECGGEQRGVLSRFGGNVAVVCAFLG